MVVSLHSQAGSRPENAGRTRKGAMPAPTEPALSAAALRNRARRDQILSAAMKCFVENGFHGSSMAELAKRAGMSVGHIYHYYESKDAIIEAIVDRDIEEAPGMLDAFSGAPRPDGGDDGSARRDSGTPSRSGQGRPCASKCSPRPARNPRIAEKTPLGGRGSPQPPDPGALRTAHEPQSGRGRRPRRGHPPPSSKGSSCEPSTTPTWTATHSSAPCDSSYANCSPTKRQPHRHVESSRFAGRCYAERLPESPFTASSSRLNCPWWRWRRGYGSLARTTCGPRLELRPSLSTGEHPRPAGRPHPP